LALSLSSPPPTSPLFPYTTLFRSREHPVQDLQHLAEAHALGCLVGLEVPLQELERLELRRELDLLLLCVLRQEPEVLHEALHVRSEEHTSELQSLAYLVCRLLLEK